MKLRRPLVYPALTVGMLLVASTALAQPVEFAVIDTNDDGFLDEAELLAASIPASLLSLDQDGDGLLSGDEVQAGSPDAGGQDTGMGGGQSTLR